MREVSRPSPSPGALHDAAAPRMIEDMKLRNFAPTTIRSTSTGSPRFAKHFGKSPERLGPDEVRAYLLFLVEEQRLLELLQPDPLRPPVPLPRHPRQGLGRGRRRLPQEARRSSPSS